MFKKGHILSFKPLEILTEEKINEIHKSTLEILEDTGVTFASEKALNLFKKNDCNVDFETKRVRFPSWLVEDCIRKTPSSFHCRAREAKNDVRIGGNTVYFALFPGMQTVDLDTWEPRTATKKEYYDFVKVLDALDNLDILWAYPYFGFEGLDPLMYLPEDVAAKIRNSTKLQLAANNQESDIFAIQMAKAVNIDILTLICTSSPLTYIEDQINCAFRAVESGFPSMLASGCVYGGTAPATIAGATITNNAELLAGVVLLNLIKPGAKIMVQDFTFPQNMRTGAPSFGDIGSSLHHVVFNQIWRKYEIPINNASISISKSSDFQNGYEKAIPSLIDALSGANTINMNGGISAELTAHPVQAILDDDIAGMIGRFIEGIDVNEETLAMNLIAEVGPIPGVYLDKEHTRKWWKKEQFLPKVADRLTYPQWKKSGRKSCLDYAKERFDEILTTYKPMPLTSSQEGDIEKILEEARQYYNKKSK